MARNWFLTMAAAATALWPVGAMAQDRTIRRAESQREAGNLRGAELREALRNRPQQVRGQREDFGRDRQQWREARDSVPRENRPSRREWTSERGPDRRDDGRDWASERGADRRDDRAGRRDGRRDDVRGRRDWQRDRYRRSQWGDGDRNWYDRRDRGDDWGRRDWSGRGYADGRWNGDRGWNRDWRRDGRYDWRGYRQANRSIYRLPRYYAPHDYFGGYQRFGIGLTLGPSLFGQDYWLSDPWAYRLPPAGRPYRWVRYYNDALLVDVDSGQVVDVEYDIFW